MLHIITRGNIVFSGPRSLVMALDEEFVVDNGFLVREPPNIIEITEKGNPFPEQNRNSRDDHLIDMICIQEFLSDSSRIAEYPMK